MFYAPYPHIVVGVRRELAKVSKRERRGEKHPRFVVPRNGDSRPTSFMASWLCGQRAARCALLRTISDASRSKIAVRIAQISPRPQSACFSAQPLNSHTPLLLYRRRTQIHSAILFGLSSHISTNMASSSSKPVFFFDIDNCVCSSTSLSCE